MVAPVRPPELRRLEFAGVAFALVVGAGFVGYQLIAGFSPIDALYMTVITVSTVGFAEVGPLGPEGRLLTIALIAAGVGTVSYSALTAAEFVVEGHLGHYIERRRMHRSIEALDEHIIVCGYGRVGRHLVESLDREGVAFVVVEADPSQEAVLEAAGRLFVLGDASLESVLVEAGIERARAVVASVRADADNVLITLTARGLRPEMEVIARAKSDENEKKLVRAGASRVILPESIGGRRIASLLTRPTVSDFLEGLGVGGVDYTLDEVHVSRDDDLAGLTLRDAGIRERYGCSVLAVRRNDGQLDTNPSAAGPLGVGDVLVVMGSESDVRRLRDAYR
jgi:voltage-gated potassium channel